MNDDDWVIHRNGKFLNPAKCWIPFWYRLETAQTFPTKEEAIQHFVRRVNAQGPNELSGPMQVREAIVVEAMML